MRVHGPTGARALQSSSVKLAKVLSGIGRTLITLGVLILLFVAYQLWGTGIREAQAQDRLHKQFDQKVAQTDDSPTVGSSGSSGSSASTGSSGSSGSDSPTVQTTPTSVAPSTAAPPEGEALGKIEIPKIGLSAYVVEGVGDDDLKNGPGHYPDTPLPGQQGNAGIAGHRTTYGAPFANIDDLAVGDDIVITTVQGKFTYKVIAQADGSPHAIVAPSAVEVLGDFHDNRLTLTACHPKYSAAQRIVVAAVLQGNALPAAPRKPPQQLDLGLGGKRAPKLPVFLFGLLCAAIWFAAWWVGRRWRKWVSYAIGLPFFLVALFFFFENFSRLLPSNF